MKQFMGLDGISVKQLAKQLNSRLKSCNIDKIQQPGRYDLLITFRAGGSPKLLLSCDPARPAAYIAAKRRSNPLQAPMFCMFLRKHLGGAKLLSAETPAYERLIRFRFSKRDEIGDEKIRSLIIEMMGRHSNIILTDEHDIIMDAMIHVDESISRYREVLPARPYLPPPPQDKPMPAARLNKMQTQTPEEFLEGFTSQKLERALLDLCLGLSPVLSREILWRCEIDPGRKKESLRADEIRQLYKVSMLFLEEIINLEGGAGFYYPEAKRGRGDCHAMELDSLGPVIRMPDLSTAVEKADREHQAADRLQQKCRQLSERVRKALEKNRRLLDTYEADIAGSEDFAEKKKHAELLLSQLAQLPERVPEDGTVDIIDYYDPDLKKITLTLDPRYDMAGNANRLFKAYDKNRSRYKYATRKLKDTLAETDYLSSFIPLLEHAESVEALETVEEELDRALGDKGKKQKSQRRGRRRKPKEQRALPPRRYTSSDGLTILAGRNNYQNDTLTFRTANPHDIWLHAKDRPGTHVILRSDSPEEIPEQSLKEAAEIAAWLSRTSGEKQMAGTDMDIDYCPVSHVRKPRGAKPGFVLYDNYQTVRAEAKAHEDLSDRDKA